MAKFKVGDKVRSTNDYTLGWTGEVFEVDYGVYRVKHDNGEENGLYYEYELELVEEAVDESSPTTPTFAVGDRVRFNERGKRLLSEQLGVYVNPHQVVEGVVTGRLDIIQRINVRLDDYALAAKDGTDWAADPSILEKVEDTPTTTPKRTVARSSTTRTIQLELAIIGDDRPAPNGDEFAKSMLAFFDDSDADAMLAYAKKHRNTDMAIDIGCFALSVKRARKGEAA